MNTCSLQFSDFIHDFNLIKSESYNATLVEPGVCFNANINFNLMAQNFSIPSEVQMEAVFSGDIDTIHFLNPVIEQYKMPVIFNEINHQFLYINNTGLLIAGNLPLFGPFTISIFPMGGECKPSTLIELKCKKYN